MVQVNLIPASVQVRQACMQRMRRWGFLVALAAAALAAPLLNGHVQESRAIAMEHRLKRFLAERVTLREDVRRITDEAHQAKLQLERARALRGKRAWSQLLTIVVHQMPEACWLNSIATDPASPTGGTARVVQTSAPLDAATGASVVIDAPRRLRLVGFASSAGQPHEFVTNLRKTNVFRDVVLEWARAEPGAKGSSFRFQLSCEW